MNGMQWTNGCLLLNSLPGNWLQVWPDGPNLFLPHKDIYFSLPLTSVTMETVPLAGRRRGPTLCFLHLVREANSYTHETKERVRKYMRCTVRKVVPLKFPRIPKWGEKWFRVSQTAYISRNDSNKYSVHNKCRFNPFCVATQLTITVTPWGGWRLLSPQHKWRDWDTASPVTGPSPAEGRHKHWD